MLVFDIEPFVGALPIRFGMRADEVRAALGNPNVEAANWKKTPQWRYHDHNMNLTFGGRERLLIMSALEGGL